jgi:hypothetical protein
MTFSIGGQGRAAELVQATAQMPCKSCLTGGHKYSKGKQGTKTFSFIGVVLLPFVSGGFVSMRI